MQDITSEISVPLRTEELHIQQELQQLHLQKQQQLQRVAISAAKPLPLKEQNQRIITRSQSSKVIQDPNTILHQLKQQQSLPTPLHVSTGTNQANANAHHPHATKSVSILVYKTLNTVFKSSRKIIVRVCEVASVKKSFTMFKFNKAAANKRAENRANACTGHDQFVRPPVPEKKVKHIMKKLHKQNGLKRSNSAIEFDVSALSAANRRHLYSRNRSASSEQDNSDHSEHSEKSPLVSARLDNLAKLFFSKSMPAETGSRDTIESVLTTRPNIKYQYSALDSGNGIVERSPRERAQRERALNATQEWIHNCNGRYEVIVHLDEIGSRHGKHWFLVTDASVRTDRLMTLLPIPADCVAFEDLPQNDNPKAMLMELLGSLHHPYVYPVLDLGFIRTSNNSTNYACLVTPFNSRGSLKDLIYKTQWNEPWSRKYTRKPTGLPVTQIQRLGRQILEALLFLKERGFPLHGHLHSGNVILQNGAARLSGLENGLLGLSSRINAIMWSRSTTEIENVDIICFGHLLYEMCTGQEMTTPKPSMRVLEMELEHYPQILDALGLIFDPPSGVCPSVEDLVLCDLFRSIDLRELRGPCFNTIKPSLSRSTLNLLHAVKKRQCATLGNSLSETSSPCSPPTTPHDRPTGISRTMHSFDISSDSEEGLLDEIVVGNNYHQLSSHARTQYYQQYAATSSLASSSHAAHYAQHQHHHHHHYQFHTKQQQQQQYFDAIDSPIHYCDNATHSDDNSYTSTQEIQQQEQLQQHQKQQPQQQQPIIYCSSSTSSNLNMMLDGTAANTPTTAESEIAVDDSKAVDNVTGQLELEEQDGVKQKDNNMTAGSAQQSHATLSSLSSAGASFNHQLTADMCNYKNSKSRRLEYSLKCLKYGRSNPSQDSAFGSLTDNDLSIGSSSFRLNSFQSISSPIDEGVEDVIIATTTAGNETCLELATIPRNMISQDSAISSPCRETSPCQFLHVEDGMSGGSCSAASSSSSSTGNVRPQQFPASLSPKILVTATTNSSNSSLASLSNGQSNQPQQPQHQQFDPPKILVNDQNSIYTTSPSKRSGTIEVFSQKYRVSSFEDMSPIQRSDKHHLKNANRLAFRSLEEERRIDNAFIPIVERTSSDNRVNMQSEKYKKLTHASFRISKTSSQVTVFDNTVVALANSTHGSNSVLANGAFELQRPATASGSSSSRQTMWRDSKFYRKNHIAKSNDSLLETSPKHSARLSPSSLRDNQYDSLSSYASRSQSRQSLNRGGSVNEFNGSNQTLGIGLPVTSNLYCSNGGRRYCSSKSEDLVETGSDYLRVMDARKSYSERHLVTLNKLKQTAINNTGSTECCLSEDELSFNDDNNLHLSQYDYHFQKQQQRLYHYQQQQLIQQQQAHFSNIFYKRPHANQLSWSACSINHLKTTNIKTTSLSTLPACQTNLSEAPSTHIAATTTLTSTSTGSLSSLDQVNKIHLGTSAAKTTSNAAYQSIANPQDSSCSGSGAGSSTTCDTATEENSSPEDSPSHRTLSGMELSKIFTTDASSCSEEKTPLLDSVELSPISPTEPDLDKQ